MTVSSSSDFTRTRDQIIGRALRLIGAIKAGETPGAQEVTDANEALNGMVKRWQKKQLHVWSVSEATLFPQVDQARYALSSSSTDHATETYYATEISAAEASGQTVLSVDSTTNMTVADNIGVVVDDGTLHWSTVASKTSTTVTINDALDDSASAGAAVYTYTTKIVRPLAIPAYSGAVRRYSIASEQDSPIGPPIARMEYQSLPNKAQSGIINQVWYDPGREIGYLYLWNPPTAVTDLIKFTYHRPIMDFDAAGDTPDLPQEWFDALTFNLAVSIAPEYDIPMEKFQQLGIMAAAYLDDVSGDDREGESFFMQPDTGP